MCYLIAKRIDGIGCIAYQTIHGKKLADFTEKLLDEIGYNNIELLTISKPSAYEEYGPYQFIDSQSAFEKAVLAMQ